MSAIPKVDTVSFPGGYDVAEEIAAIKLSAMKHVAKVPLGETESVIVERFLKALVARHPEVLPFGDPYSVRAQELFEERRSLLHSHLGFTWFSLAYWTYGLVAVRTGLSIAEHNGLDMFVTPVQGALKELGIRVSKEECLDEIDRFLPPAVSAHGIEAATHAFLSFARFLHFAALRRRQVVTPGLTLPSVCLAFADDDAQQAQFISKFLTSHGVSLVPRPEDATQTARLLVLLSREAIGSDAFWRGLAAWKLRPVVPMVVCLMPKAELYREPPSGVAKELWSWLGENVATELGSQNDRYMMLLRALDSPDPMQWWWNYGNAMELGLAVDVMGDGIPRPPTRPRSTGPTGEPYPFALEGMHASACFFASDRLARDEASGRDARYFAICHDLIDLRKRPGGEPYTLPWFVLAYRAWLAFATSLPGQVYSEEDAAHAERELQAALFALGIGTQAAEVPAFLEAFTRLPWTTPASSIATVDERAVTFMVLVHHLTQAALARGQRMRLQHPACACFISYARQDESLARELVAHLEAKGADVWWDLDAMTLGTPLDASLSRGVEEAKILFLIATPAADASTYVQFEVESALRQGLRIVPITPEGRLPAGLRSKLASIPGSVESLISASDADRLPAFTAALDHLQRAPDERLRWLQSRALYKSLLTHVMKVRASPDKAALS